MSTVTLLGIGPLAHAIARMARSTDQLRLYAPAGGSVAGLESKADLAEAVDGSSAVVFCGPTDQLWDLAIAYGRVAEPNHIGLVPARGVGPGFELPLTTLRKATCLRKIGILGGPLHVRELDAERHVNVVIATRFPEVPVFARSLVDPGRVTVHHSSDVVGVQVAGVYSHIASLVVGMAHGLGLSDTARGLLLAQSLSEARSIGAVLGADDRTFASVAGLGELIPRPSGGSDRHLEVGRRLAQGASFGDATADLEAEVEGVRAAEEAVRLARAKGLDVPVASAVLAAVQSGRAPHEVVDGLLRRPLPETA